MNVLHYTLDLRNLFDTQDAQSEFNSQQEQEKIEQGLKNKKELLKYVLPLMHGIFELHNRRCTRTTSSTTGKDGLLGYNKKDTQRELDHIVESSCYWSDNFNKFEYRLTGRYSVKIWLNSSLGCHQATPHLPYSMLEVIPTENIYGKSIEEELIKVAKECARYKDSWID